MSTMTKKAALGAVASLLALTAMVGGAEAHHRKHRHLFFVEHHDCSFYKWKWLSTGKLFWKMKYFECMSW